MLYSYDDLKSVKYTELLKISKSLQLKSGRQKAEKVIQLILKCQETLQEEEKDGEMEMIEDIEFPEHALVSDDEINCSLKSPSKDDSKNDSTEPRRSRKRNIDAVDGDSTNVPLRRSNTFVIEKGSANKSNVQEPQVQSPKAINKTVSSDKRNRSTRGREFDVEHVESPSKRRRISESRSTPIVKSPDLTCSEVLTAADIKEVEESPLNPAFKSAKNFKMDVAARRSLRGQLLNSRLTRRISSFDALPSPVIRDKASRFKAQTDTKASPITKTDEKSATFNREIRGSTPTKRTPSKQSLNNSTSDQDHKVHHNETKSGIPRFVTYARKLNVPDFSRIHKKNFQKMEGVDDYLERKQLRAGNAQSPFCLSTSKKAPSVFKPSVSSTKDMKLNFTAILPSSTNLNKSVVKKSATKSTIKKLTTADSTKEKGMAKENLVPAKTRLDFNKAQVTLPLRRKMTTGARRANLSSFSRTKSFTNAAKKAPKIMSSTERRAKQSSFLKGVRLNKRFELQMAKRGLKLN